MKKIFFIFGFHKSPFLRLAHYAWQLKEKGYDVFVQNGHTKLSMDIPHSSFLSYEEMVEKIKCSDLIVCHAGTGSIMTCLFHNKKPVVVPRYKKLNEHVDNHQMEICNKFGSKNLIELIYKDDLITDKINFMLQNPLAVSYQRDNKCIRTIVSSFLEQKPVLSQKQIQKVSILNCRIDNYHNITEVLNAFDKGIFVSANVHMITIMQKNRFFLACYQSSDYCVNDSQILYFSSKLLRTPLRARISGSDFFPAFCEYHKNDDNVLIFLLGSKEGVAKIAQKKINDKIGRKIVIGEYSPPFGFENNPDFCDKIVKQINESKATVLVVGLSAPKGENWVYTYKNRLPAVKWYICAGATIDFESGIVQRAPLFIQKIGCEWLYRILIDPKRLWKRYLIEDMPFFWLLFKQLLGIYKDPFYRYSITNNNVKTD